MPEQIKVSVPELLQEIGRLTIENRILHCRLGQSRASLLESLGRNNNQVIGMSADGGGPEAPPD